MVVLDKQSCFSGFQNRVLG
ncbi:hypothetical protein OIU84_017679 [Salix udensis]|uniref:Uncharacterized protein n=1 Tax=Salix udensis TaxID=889485 RepID=A0AAD6L2D8_9ROSI|nr:hypothetical protein OIU84_017679 [Salix udensis]